MTDQTAPAETGPIRLERTYDATADRLWAMWTTKEGIESWWGPEGFRVEVHELDLRIGGALRYDMIAAGAEQIAYMKSQGMGDRHGTHGTFVEIEPNRRLKIEHIIDFIPGVDPYENGVVVEFVPDGDRVRMVITVDRHRDEHWTQMAAAGWASQLTKLPAALGLRSQ